VHVKLVLKTIHCEILPSRYYVKQNKAVSFVLGKRSAELLFTALNTFM